MELVELEIACHDWAALDCGCGRSATHVAADLSRMARATTAKDADIMLSAGESQATDAAARGRDLPAECIAAIRPGIWLLYSEVFAGRSLRAAAHAYETLTLVDADANRLARVQAAAGDRLPWDLR